MLVFAGGCVMLNFMKFIVFSVTVILLAMPLSAKADELSEIRSFFEGYLDQVKQQAMPNDVVISYEGPLLVEQAQGYYSVTTPAVTVDAGLVFQLGNLSFNIAVDPNSDNWMGRVAYATPIIITSPDGRETREVHLGSQNNVVTIDKDLSLFTSIEINIDNVMLRDTQGNIHAQVETLRMDKTMADIDRDALQAYRNLGDFFYAGTGDINIALLGAEFYINRLLQQRGADTAQQTRIIAKAKELNIDMAHAIQNDLIDYLVLFNADDLYVTENGEPTEFPVPAQLRFQTMLKGVSRDLYEDMLNENKALLQEHKDKIANPDSVSEAEKEQINAAFNATFDRFIEAAQKAGANFAYQLFLADRKDRTIKIETDVVGDDEHPIGMFGTTVLTARGLESWLDSFQLSDNTQIQGIPEGMPVPKTVPAPLKATLLNLAQEKTLNDGATAHVFNFVITQDGQMSVNGNNMQIVMGMLLSALMQGGMSEQAPTQNSVPSQDTPL